MPDIRLVHTVSTSGLTHNVFGQDDIAAQGTITFIVLYFKKTYIFTFLILTIYLYFTFWNLIRQFINGRFLFTLCVYRVAFVS